MSPQERKIKAKQLQKELHSWTYLGHGSSPPTLEEAWILHSQIEWKRETILPETLWEDLPYTDPGLILFLITENEESLIPAHTIRKLYETLLKLQKVGINIQEEFFSLNWSKNQKRHGGSRNREIKKNNKPYKTGKKERLKAVAPKKEKKTPKKSKKPSKSFIMSLFGL